MLEFTFNYALVSTASLNALIFFSMMWGYSHIARNTRTS